MAAIMVGPRRWQRTVDDFLGLERRRLFRQAVPAFGHQRIETIHQLLDLVLVLRQRGVVHFLFAAGHLFADTLLLAVRKLLLLMLDLAARCVQHPHQAVAHFRSKLGLSREVIGLILDHRFGRARVYHDLATSLVDRVLHVFLPLLFQGIGLADFSARSDTVRRGKTGVAALEIQIARITGDGRNRRHLGDGNGGTSGQNGRGPDSFLGDRVLDRFGVKVVGVAMQGFACQAIGIFQLSAIEGLTGQVGQTAASSFNLVFRRGQTCGIDQRQCATIVNLRLIHQGDQVAVAGAGLQFGNVPGQLFRAGRTVDSHVHVLGRDRLFSADHHRIAVAPQGRKTLRINVQTVGPLHGATGIWASNLWPKHRAMNGLGQTGAKNARIHVGLLGHDNTPGAGSQNAQHLLLNSGANTKGDYRHALSKQFVDNAIELIGRELVGTTTAIANVDDGTRRFAVARKAFHSIAESILQIAGAQRSALIERVQGRGHFWTVGGHKPLGQRRRVQIKGHEPDAIVRAQIREHRPQCRERLAR